MIQYLIVVSCGGIQWGIIQTWKGAKLTAVIICLVTVVINKAQKSGGRMILCQDCSKSLGHLWNPVILTL